jgi:hypothetical protein
MGPRWSAIAQFFPGRTDIGVKNKFIGLTGKIAKQCTGFAKGDELFGSPDYGNEVQTFAKLENALGRREGS